MQFSTLFSGLFMEKYSICGHCKAQRIWNNGEAGTLPASFLCTNCMVAWNDLGGKVTINGRIEIRVTATIIVEAGEDF